MQGLQITDKFSQPHHVQGRASIADLFLPDKRRDLYILHFPTVRYTQAKRSIGTLCRVLRVSKSGYYGWRNHPPSARSKADAVLIERIKHIHRDSDTYGAPRVHAELRASGIRCGKKRVARLMRKATLVGCGGRRRVRRTTRRYVFNVPLPPRQTW